MSVPNNSTECAIAAALLFVESHNRDKAKITLNQRYAARYAQLSLEAQKQRFAHAETCGQCNAMEAAA